MTASQDDGKTPAGKTAAPGTDPVKPGATGSGVPNAGAKPAEPSASTAGKPAEPSAAADRPGGPPAGKAPEATKATEPGKVTAAPSASDPAKTGAAAPIGGVKPSEPPAKAGATGSSAVPPGTPPKPPEMGRPGEPAKAGATGSSAVRPDAAKGDAAGKPSGPPPGVSRVGAGDAVTDGPILDMKPKPAPDPAAKTGRPTDDKGMAQPRSAPSSGGGPGYGLVAASGLLGGVLGAGLFYALAHSGASGGKPDESRLAALDQKVAALASRDAVAALDKRVAANEQALKPLPEAVKKAEERAGEALQKAGGAPTAEGAPPAPPTDLAARLDALDQRVSALQEEPAKDQPADSKTTTLKGDDAARLADLDERLKAIETKGEASPEGQAPAPQVAQKLAALQGDVDARAKVSESAVQALGQRVDQFQQTIDARLKSTTDEAKQLAESGKARAEEAAKTLDKRFEEQGEKIAALDKALDGTAKAATVQTALRIVAADRVATALAAGLPYADALASLRSAGADDKRLDALAPFAETGAPTASSLAQSFRPIGEKIAAGRRAAKARTAAETGSIADRLQSMASSIVQVKKVGTSPPGAPVEASEDDPTAKVQDALDRGRIREAAQAFAALPEDVRSQAGDFGVKLKARADAEAAAQAVQADAFKGLPAPAAGR